MNDGGISLSTMFKFAVGNAPDVALPVIGAIPTASVSFDSTILSSTIDSLTVLSAASPSLQTANRFPFN